MEHETIPGTCPRCGKPLQSGVVVNDTYRVTYECNNVVTINKTTGEKEDSNSCDIFF